MKKEAPERFHIPVSHPTLLQWRWKTVDSSETLVSSKLYDFTFTPLSWKLSQDFPPKFWHISTKQHGLVILKDSSLNENLVIRSIYDQGKSGKQKDFNQSHVARLCLLIYNKDLGMSDTASDTCNSLGGFDREERCEVKLECWARERMITQWIIT
jgi:hypothetical protein